MSQSKHYCKFCNCWVADNRPSIQHHEQGAKHREKVELFHKARREERFQGKQSERELKQQMDEIERAAKEALEADKQDSTGMFYKVFLPFYLHTF